MTILSRVGERPLISVVLPRRDTQYKKQVSALERTSTGSRILERGEHAS